MVFPNIWWLNKSNSVIEEIDTLVDQLHEIEWSGESMIWCYLEGIRKHLPDLKYYCYQPSYAFVLRHLRQQMFLGRDKPFDGHEHINSYYVYHFPSREQKAWMLGKWNKGQMGYDLWLVKF